MYRFLASKKDNVIERDFTCNHNCCPEEGLFDLENAEVLQGGKMIFADVSETVSQPGSSGLIQLLTPLLQSAQQTEEVTVVPSLLMPRKALSQQEVESLLRIEDQMLFWFRKNHFEGDRVRKNLHGYPGLFRELFEHPPWVEDITMDEFLGESSEERERELRPLYEHCLEQGEKLLETYQAYLVRCTERSPLLSQLFEREKLGLQGLNERGDLDENERLLLQNLLDASNKGLSLTDSFALDDLERKIKLARLLGSEAIENLYEAIIPDFDEYSVVNGAPDLFLWHPNPAYNLWFFAEVKGPGDHLRESQSRWIRGFWKHVCGRVVILHVY